jgi:hypothetical protein
MLEHPSLFLRPWAPEPSDANPAGWRRNIDDGRTGAPLGAVRWSGRVDSPWVAWFRSQRLEVFETDDDSLLLVVVQPWGLLRLWDVYDADEQRVGSVYPPVLLDGEGLRRGYLRRDGDHGQILAATSGGTLAEFDARGHDGLRVTFADEDEPNPFLRMLLLAGLLTIQFLPARPH